MWQHTSTQLRNVHVCLTRSTAPGDQSIGLVIFCAAFYGETVTSLEALGYTVSLASFVFYNYVRIQEASALQPRGPVAQAAAASVGVRACVRMHDCDSLAHSSWPTLLCV